MEIDPDSGPGPEPGPSTQAASGPDFTVSAMGLVSRTLSLWSRNLVAYIIIVGVASLLIEVLWFVVYYALFGALAGTYLNLAGTDPLSFIIAAIQLALTVLPQETIVLLVGVNFIMMLVSTVVYAIIQGGAIKYALDDYGHRNGDVSEALSFASGKAVTLIIANLLIGLITAGAMMPGLLLLLFATTIDMLFVALGVLILSFLFAFFILVRIAPTSAIVIAEDKSALDSIKRAYELTRGQFFHVLGGQIILAIVTFLISFVIAFVLIAFTLGLGVIGGLIPGIIFGLLFAAIPYVFQAVLYRDLLSRQTTSEQDWW